MSEEPITVFRIQRQDNFCVGIRLESIVTALGLDLAKSIDSTVKRDAKITVIRQNRLPPSCYIDDV